MAPRTCIVSYYDTNCRYSVEVMANTLHEAVVLGKQAMGVRTDSLHLRSFDIAVKSPVVHQNITGPMLMRMRSMKLRRRIIPIQITLPTLWPHRL
jgi:hypothetical protein